MMLSDDPAKVRADLAKIAKAYDPGLAPSPAHRAAPPEVPAGSPPLFTLGQAEHEAEAAFSAGYAAEDARQAAGSPAGGGDPGQAEADPAPLTKAPGDKT